MLTFLAESESYLHILTSPAHILAELTIELLTGVVVYPIGRKVFRRWLARHDAQVHNHSTEGR